MGFDVAETKRRLDNVVIHGEVVELSDDALFARVKFGDESEEVESDFLPILQRRSGKDGEEWPVEVGEKVVVICSGGYLEMGFILGSLPTEKEARKLGVHRVRYADGTSIEYDKKTHTLTVDCAGTISIKANEGASISIEGKCAITAKEECTVSAKNVSIKGEDGTLLGLAVEAGAARQTAGVVTGECICAFTGAPHPDFSKSVKAEK